MKGLCQVLLDESLQAHVDRYKIQESSRYMPARMPGKQYLDRMYRPDYGSQLYKRAERNY